MSVDLLHGDNLEVLPRLQERSVQCVVTSPPYYGLRDYGLPPTLWPTVSYLPMAGLPALEIPGCDPACAHEWGEPVRAPWANTIAGPNGRDKNTEASRKRGKTSGEYCQHCGGWRGCLGLEPDPLAFIGHLVHVFRLVWRVLRDNGVCWLNLGDSYAAGGNGGGGKFMAQRARKAWEHRADRRGYRSAPAGLKEKDLLGIPWRAAMALQADGWYLRSDVIWVKPNCMPESTRDRPTKAHEYIFLLAKSERYFFDANAIAEPAVAAKGNSRSFRGGGAYTGGRSFHNHQSVDRETHGNIPNELGVRNVRTVWQIPSSNYAAAHFATFPEALAERCIRAGSRAGDTVLDPFGGSGTTGRVAERLNRNAVLIELNPDYISLQERRTDGVQRELLLAPSLPIELIERLAAFGWSALPDGDGWLLSGNGDDAHFSSLAGLEDWLRHQERATQKREAA
jgi:DNA modification methylase